MKNDDDMSPLLKRSVQATFIIVVIFYSTLLLFERQNIVNDLDPPVTADKWQPKEEDYDQSAGVTEDKKTEQSPPKLYPQTEITATPSYTTTYLEDIFISVKTTRHYHHTRLEVILKTWFLLAKDQTWFFTDVDEPELRRLTNGHIINTNCSASHNRKALCCKMSVEFDTFLESTKKWFCHFDDDNYVNIPRLLEILSNYNPEQDWYLGKPSIRTPLEIQNREHPHLNQNTPNISFWFATGGAGFCLSRTLAMKMVPIASDGKFMTIGEKIRLPDDVTMGYIIEHKLKKALTVIKEFHSHLEPMKFLQPELFHKQISFSYSRYETEMNTVRIDGLDVRIDPTRFYSLHCFLFPQSSFCPNR